jgi:hypothetical protein
LSSFHIEIKAIKKLQVLFFLLLSRVQARTRNWNKRTFEKNQRNVNEDEEEKLKILRNTRLCEEVAATGEEK